MDDEMGKQVERAVAKVMDYWIPATTLKDFASRFATDLLAGKFKEEPLPEIARPPWNAGDVRVTEWLGGDGGYRIYATQADHLGHAESWGGFYGPVRTTKRAAIEAWNAVFAVKSMTGEKFAEELLKLGSDAGDQCNRIAFMGGEWPSKEYPLGGMERQALLNWARKLT